jgi:hypothetical protein
LMTVTSMQKSIPYSQFEINTSAGLSSVFAINPTSSDLNATNQWEKSLTGNQV